MDMQQLDTPVYQNNSEILESGMGVRMGVCSDDCVFLHSDIGKRMAMPLAHGQARGHVPWCENDFQL